MQNQRPFAFHPFLLACFSILSLYSYNINQLPFGDVVGPLALMAVPALVLLIALRLLRDDGRAALVLSLLIIAVFSYGHVRSFVNGLYQGDLARNQKDWFFWVWIAEFAVMAVAVVILPRITRPLTSFLNATSAALILVCLLSCSLHWLSSGRTRRAAARDDWQQIGLVSSQRPERLPDIYYLIFDRYAGARTLRDLYKFDNRPFLDSLASRGFRIARFANANYLKTALSLLSSLNFEYLDYLTTSPGRKSTDWLPAYSALQDYRVWRFLKTYGYRFYHFGSWWEPTSRNRFADRSYNVRPLREFTMLWWKTTILFPMYSNHPGMRKFLNYNDRELQYKRTRYILKELERLPSQPSPKFVFSHVLVPHDPFVFEPDGSLVPEDVAYHRAPAISYVHQVMYVNNRITELVDSILARSAQPPVIIVQADEGPYPERFKVNDKGFKWRKATRSEVRQKLGILNALYLPGADSTIVYDTLSPVNNFRIVFNTYFHTRLQLLPDRCYAFSDGLHPYDFFDITDRARQKKSPRKR